MIRAIVFDCFGVLLTDALSQIVDDIRAHDPDKADRIVGIVVAANRGVLDPRASRLAVVAELGLSYEQYADRIRNGEVRNEALFAYIKTLRGSYKMALLSNITSGGLQVRFPGDELREYFDVVVASGEVGYAKPDPKAYEITAKWLGVTLDECVMVDDRQVYCDGAERAGMHAVLYTDMSAFKLQLAAMLRAA